MSSRTVESERRPGYAGGAFDQTRTFGRPDTVVGRSQDGLLLIGRVLLGGIFVQSGFAKLMALGAFAASLEKAGVPAPSVLAVIGACVEFFGGLAVVLGLATRYAAGLMILFVIAATLISHRYWEIHDAARRAQEVNFFKNVAIVGGFTLLLANGAGRFALDRLWRRPETG